MENEIEELSVPTLEEIVAANGDKIVPKDQASPDKEYSDVLSYIANSSDGRVNSKGKMDMLEYDSKYYIEYGN